MVDPAVLVTVAQAVLAVVIVKVEEVVSWISLNNCFLIVINNTNLQRSACLFQMATNRVAPKEALEVDIMQLFRPVT